jgi:hypothetical protein
MLFFETVGLVAGAIGVVVAVSVALYRRGLLAPTVALLLAACTIYPFYKTARLGFEGRAILAITIAITVALSLKLYRNGYRLTSFFAWCIAPPILYLPVSFVFVFIRMLIDAFSHGSPISALWELLTPFAEIYSGSGTAHGYPIWFIPMLGLLTLAILTGTAWMMRRRGVALSAVLPICALLIPFVPLFLLWLTVFVGMGAAILGGRGF